MNTHIHKGIFLTKEAPTDKKAADEALEVLHNELGNILAAQEKNRKDTDTHFIQLSDHYKGMKADSDELKSQVLKHSAEYAALVTQQQALQQALDQVKKEMDTPLLK